MSIENPTARKKRKRVRSKADKTRGTTGEALGSQDVAKVLAEAMRVNPSEARATVDAVFSVVAAMLINGSPVRIEGFGTFDTKTPSHGIRERYVPFYSNGPRATYHVWLRSHPTLNELITSADDERHSKPTYPRITPDPGYAQHPLYPERTGIKRVDMVRDAVENTHKELLGR